MDEPLGRPARSFPRLAVSRHQGDALLAPARDQGLRARHFGDPLRRQSLQELPGARRGGADHRPRGARPVQEGQQRDEPAGEGVHPPARHPLGRQPAARVDSAQRRHLAARARAARRRPAARKRRASSAATPTTTASSAPRCACARPSPAPRHPRLEGHQPAAQGAGAQPARRRLRDDQDPRRREAAPRPPRRRGRRRGRHRRALRTGRARPCGVRHRGAVGQSLLHPQVGEEVGPRLLQRRDGTARAPPEGRAPTASRRATPSRPSRCTPSSTRRCSW